ncbi:MAG: tripartite tricarboxylate transporter TctB family protein, partial [Rhizobiales bacterium]|nr:tripartite tricarboxylate transporter TctB family protein [Hyphomicrobiales bacterium]
FFPFYIGLIILAASIINLTQIWTANDKTKLYAEWGQLRQVSFVVIPTAVYVTLIPWIGIYAASVLLIGLFMKWLGRYGWPLVMAVAIGVPVATFVIFEKWFLVPLPKGPIEAALGF